MLKEVSKRIKPGSRDAIMEEPHKERSMRLEVSQETYHSQATYSKK